MIAAPLGWLLVWLAAAAALAADGPWWLRGALILPATLWAPGAGWARWLNPRLSRLQEVMDAAWLSAGLAVVDVAIARGVGGGLGRQSWLLMGLSLAWTLAGFAVGRRGPNPPAPSNRVRLGLVAVVAALALAGSWRRGDLTRPLDAYWYHPQANSDYYETAGWRPLAGFGAPEAVGWEGAGGARLPDPELDGGSLELDGVGFVVLRGPVGATLSAGSERTEIEADVVEAEQPEAVPRYLDRGAVALMVGPGEIALEVEGADEGSALYVLPGTDAIWEAHGLGELRFFHYYQLLNIVENQRWAAELLEDRRLTVNQPPLWSHLLAVSLLVEPGLRGAAALFMWVLVLLGISGVRLLELAAPRAPWAAWLLPGAMAAVHLKLMAEPGSFNFPDSLYAASFPAGLAALALSMRRGEGAPRFGLLALLSGLLRYPGTVALSLSAAVYGLLHRTLPRRELGSTWGLVGAAAAGLGLAALISGQLREWLFILWFETVPEHFQNNPEPPPLALRPPIFYATWLKYTGGGLALAAVGAIAGGRAARWILGSALAYSLFLCCIDHFPTHYFLPLVALTGAALGAGAGGLRSRPAGEVLAALGVLGAVWFFLWGVVSPVELGGG